MTGSWLRWRSRSTDHQAESGAAVVWVLVMCGLLLSVAGLAAALIGVVHTQRKAQSAADLAALAAAQALVAGQDPCGAAQQISAANAAELTRCEVSGREVLVSVAAALPDPIAALIAVDNIVGRARAGPE